MGMAAKEWCLLGKNEGGSETLSWIVSRAMEGAVAMAPWEWAVGMQRSREHGVEIDDIVKNRAKEVYQWGKHTGGG